MEDIASKLAKAHCDYVVKVLQAHEIPLDVISVVEFHYVEAFKHGFKHGIEYLQGLCDSG